MSKKQSPRSHRVCMLSASCVVLIVLIVYLNLHGLGGVRGAEPTQQENGGDDMGTVEVEVGAGAGAGAGIIAPHPRPPFSPDWTQDTLTSECPQWPLDVLSEHPSAGFRVAFLADSEPSTAASRQVLQLVAKEGVDAIFHQGDFQYGWMKAADWDRWYRNTAKRKQSPDSTTEAAAPHLLGTLGNMDSHSYAPDLLQKHAREAGATCYGLVGVAAVCMYHGIAIVSSGGDVAGQRSSSHHAWIEKQLACLRQQHPQPLWTVCLWHRPVRGKSAAKVGSDLQLSLEACRRHGALVVSGHAHHYRRDVIGRGAAAAAAAHSGAASQEIALVPGTALAIVSGLGGHSVQYDPVVVNGAALVGRHSNFGALLCEFRHPECATDGSSSSTHPCPAPHSPGATAPSTKLACEFKTVEGARLDQFDVVLPG